MAWMKKAGGDMMTVSLDEVELDIQKKTWDMHNRTRSRSRSRHIMERAKSFERMAAENAAAGYNSNANSRPARCDHLLLEKSTSSSR